MLQKSLSAYSLSRRRAPSFAELMLKESYNESRQPAPQCRLANEQFNVLFVPPSTPGK